MRQKITTFALLTAVLAIGLFATIAVAKEKKEEAPKQVLIKNVNIFDGKNEKLAMGQDVLVEGNLIKKIAKGIKASGAEVIDGGGRTLMPGLTDAHVHLMLNDAPAKSIYEETWVYVGAQSVAAAKAMLLRGFTTVRDVGGPVGGLKQAIDEGPEFSHRVLTSRKLPVMRTSKRVNSSFHLISPVFPTRWKLWDGVLLQTVFPRYKKLRARCSALDRLR
jgi:hypothetical protein